MSADGDMHRLLKNVTRAISAKVERDADAFEDIIELFEDAVIVARHADEERTRWLWGGPVPEDWAERNDKAAEAEERIFRDVTIVVAR